MKFAPKTEREIAEENLFPKGEYDFEIVSGHDTISKSSGVEMIELKVRIFDEDGRSSWVTDYLLEKIAYKLRHAAEACGLLADYENGVLEGESFTGKTGRCKVSIQVDKTGAYADKNGIQDYLVPKEGVAERTSAPAKRRQMAAVGNDLGDDIPF